MKHKTFGLKEYSLIATGMLLSAINETISQVVYTDIEPDTALMNDGDILFLDLDHNAMDDFAFMKTSASIHTWYDSENYFRHIEWALPYRFENSIAAEMVTHGFGGATTYFPYKIDADELIDGEHYPYYNAMYQWLADLRIHSNGAVDLHLGKFSHDTTDGYLGVKFIDQGDCYHFGWIRLAVVDSCRKMVIKDYAYEVQCDHPIIAGSIEHYVGIEDENLNSYIEVFSSNSTIYLQVPEEMVGGQVIIRSVDERMIYTNTIKNVNAEIRISEPPGIYLVTIRSGSKQITTKVVI